MEKADQTDAVVPLQAREGEYLDLVTKLCRNVIVDLGTELLRHKPKDVNPLGGDIDLVTQLKMKLIGPMPIGGASGRAEFPSAYEKAQLAELSFWRWVAFEGYAGLDPRAFRWSQALLMLGCFMRTRWSIQELASASIVEIGCGPVGMIEYLPGREKVGFDPLNTYYDRLFQRARTGGVDYVTDLRDLVLSRAGQFDLGICFNVLDHAENAEELLDAYMTLIRRGGRFLLQLNTIRDGYERSEEHRRMHPSPFKMERIRALLDQYSSAYEQYWDDKPSADNEFFFMAWGARK